MRRRRGHVDHVEENLERWLLTYSDLITLLLATFVMMYAFSKIKEGNPNTLQIPDEAQMEQPQVKESTFLTEAQREAEEKKFRKLRQKLEKKIKKLHYTPYVRVTNEGRGLVISMSSSTTFALGSADLSKAALGVLDIVSQTLKDAPTNDVRVEGHTDDLPIHTVAYPSNWHLSTARAISVIFYFINHHRLEAERFQAQGYGDRRPLVPNTSDANRQRNRRVDIVIVKKGGEFMQPNMKPKGAQPEAPPAEPAPAEGHK